MGAREGPTTVPPGLLQFIIIIFIIITLTPRKDGFRNKKSQHSQHCLESFLQLLQFLLKHSYQVQNKQKDIFLSLLNHYWMLQMLRGCIGSIRIRKKNKSELGNVKIPLPFCQIPSWKPEEARRNSEKRLELEALGILKHSRARWLRCKLALIATFSFKIMRGEARQGKWSLLLLYVKLFFFWKFSWEIKKGYSLVMYN